MFHHFILGGQDPQDQKQYVTVFIPGHGFESADSDHPMYDSIVKCARQNDVHSDHILGLFDVGKGVEAAVANANLSSRVAVEHGTLTLDGEPMSGALVDHILKLMRENSADLTPWVRLLERVEANPNEHSRTMLFGWLQALTNTDGGFTITSDGLVVGYKGVRRNDDGSLVSVRSGPGIVNGVETNGNLANEPGSVVEMRRDSVQHDPSVGCSVGLHVGTFDYAKGWSEGAVVEVHVDPADVVSVPTACAEQKMRCAKYKVVQEIEVPHTTALLPDYDQNDWEFPADEEFCECGELVEDCEGCND